MGLRGNFAITFHTEKLEWGATRRWKCLRLCDCTRFDTTQERDGQRRTDRHATMAQAALCIASRDCVTGYSNCERELYMNYRWALIYGFTSAAFVWTDAKPAVVCCCEMIKVNWQMCCVRLWCALYPVCVVGFVVVHVIGYAIWPTDTTCMQQWIYAAN